MHNDDFNTLQQETHHIHNDEPSSCEYDVFVIGRY